MRAIWATIWVCDKVHTHLDNVVDLVFHGLNIHFDHIKGSEL